MKIRYKKITRSTDANSATLINNIIAELNKPGYIIINRTENDVEFQYNIWRFGSRADVFRTVDGGKFQISKECKTISLSYYLSPTFEIIAVFIIATLGIFQDHHIFIFIIFIGAMFFARIITSRMVSNRIMDNVLNDEL